MTEELPDGQVVGGLTIVNPLIRATSWFVRRRARALTVLTFLGGFASVLFVPLATVFGLSALVTTAVAVHLIPLLLERGHGAAFAGGAITPARAALLAEFYGRVSYATISGALVLVLRPCARDQHLRRVRRQPRAPGAFSDGNVGTVTIACSRRVQYLSRTSRVRCFFQEEQCLAQFATSVGLWPCYCRSR